jgi:hypothetical protein
VKLIDVYPDQVPSQPEMGGYQLPVSMDIFRGRYRESFEHPSAIPAGKSQRYRFVMPTTNHVFLPGHQVMVQIQSTWFRSTTGTRRLGCRTFSSPSRRIM